MTLNFVVQTSTNDIGPGRLETSPLKLSVNMEDTIEAVLPVYYSNTLDPNIHLYQFPLLERPLHVPPAAAASGKIITARHKPSTSRIEIHVPLDTRQEVWNPERGRDLGQARHDGDKASAPPEKTTREEPEPRLTEIRLRNEVGPSKGDYMLGILHGSKLKHFYMCMRITKVTTRCDPSTPNATRTPVATIPRLLGCNLAEECSPQQGWG